MPLFTWSDAYSIGNDEIDLQHKKLFNILNRLYDNSYLVESKLDIYFLLDELIDYADFHFKAEHEYMREIGYNNIEKQTIEHIYFTNEVLRLIQNREKSTSELTKETIVFLGKWLLHHVTVEDKKIAA